MDFDVNELSTAFKTNQPILKNMRVVLWVNFWGPKTSIRELIIYEIQPKDSIMALLGFKLEMNATEFLANLVAFEVGKDYFVLKESANVEHWKAFINLILKGAKPRVILTEEFRRNLGLPLELVNFDILVLKIER